VLEGGRKREREGEIKFKKEREEIEGGREREGEIKFKKEREEIEGDKV
jgi:hypothetical protein